MDELELARQRRNEYRREQYRLNGEGRKATNQKWKDANREKVREAGREYQRLLRASNPEHAKALVKRWRDKNPEKIKAMREEWYAENGKEYYKKWAAAKRISDPVLFMLRNAKNRAKEIGREFNLVREDVVMPEFCPVLGLKLEKGSTGFQPCSPSIDRMDSSKGYVQGNVQIISWRANALKRDATIEELEKVLAYMKAHAT